MKFRINLKDAHEKSGKTRYRVARDTGVSDNTVSKYTKNIIEQYTMRSSVLKLIKYYGVDWRDVIDVIDDEETPSPFDYPLEKHKLEMEYAIP